MRIDVLLIALLSAASFLPLLPKTDFITPDSPSYIVPADNLLAGRGFRGNGYATTFTQSIPGFPNVPGPETLRTPAYPLVIAMFMATGAGLRGLVLFQHLLDLGIAISLYWFLRSTIKSRAIALVAALLYAALPPAAQLANTIQPETLFTAAVLAVFITVDRAMRRNSAGLMTICGLLLGFAALVRPIAMYFFVPLVVVIAISTRRRMVLSIALLISSQLLPVAWTFRNARATGVATLSTIATENLLFEWAASVHATRNSTHLFRLTAAQQQSGFRSTLHRARLPLFYQAMAMARADGVDAVRANQARKSIYEKRLALHILREHPIEFAEILISGALELLLFEPPSIAFSLPHVPRSAETPFVFVTALVVLIVIAGIGAIHRRDRPLALLIAVTIGYFTVAGAIPEVVIRYALVYAPMYGAALAAGIVTFASRYARGSDAASSRASRAASSGPS
jgi:Dolichyl-phosphate-mannose-protein mannosyltransferase